MMNINFYVKSMGSFIILNVMWYERFTQMLSIARWPIKVQEIGEDMPSNMLSFINFEPLEFYWTYFLALQTMTPKIPLMRFISLDHEPKMRWCAMSLNYRLWRILCKYRLFWALREVFPKIHDNVDVVQVANRMKSCCVKNLSSTDSKTRIVFFKPNQHYIVILKHLVLRDPHYS